MKTITLAQFDAAMTNYSGLREAFEMRLNQHLVIDALFLDVPNEEATIFVAIYDMNEETADFSVYDRLREICDTTATATFYKTDSSHELNKFIFDTMSRELADTTI